MRVTPYTAAAFRAIRRIGPSCRLGWEALRNRLQHAAAAAARFGSGLVKNTVNLVLLAIAVIAGILLYAKLASLFSPHLMIVVQPFEVSDDVSKQLHISGKNASNYFLDELNRLVSDGAAFRGNSYSSKSHFSGIPDFPKIPVQSSYGIALEGVSIDAVIGVYNRIRYEQMAVGGDIVLAGKEVKITTRWRTDQDSEYADETDTENASLQPMIQSLVSQFLERVNPELAGRAYLHERRYDLAAETFTRWANNNSDDSMPEYYLALMTFYKSDQLPEEAKEREKEQEDEDIALLSDWMKGQFSSAKCPQQYPDPAVSGLWWQRMKARFMRQGKESPEDLADYLVAYQQLDDAELATTTPEEQHTLATHAEEGYKKLAQKYPRDTNYRMNIGKAAEILTNYQEEFEQFKLAQAIEPTNAGIERNLGSALNNLAIFGRKNTANDGKEQLCIALQHEVRALHLSLGMTDAIHDAVIVLDNLRDRDGAVGFTRIASLLSPESSAARKEYLKALVYDHKISNAIEAAALTPDGKNDLVAVMEDIANSKGALPIAVELAKESVARWPQDPTISDGEKFVREKVPRPVLPLSGENISRSSAAKAAKPAAKKPATY